MNYYLILLFNNSYPVLDWREIASNEDEAIKQAWSSLKWFDEEYDTIKVFKTHPVECEYSKEVAQVKFGKE